jgi:hypothetical protein
MNCTLRPYWVTVATGRGQTADRRILARSPWAAWWLWRTLHPGQHVLMVRAVEHGGSTDG